ncbi:right-handed parallel beta-helix repeat-containing protein, partial [candidate division KSB1 bacterium]
DVRENRLEYFIIEYTSTGITLESLQESSYPVISNGTVKNVSNYGVYLNQSYGKVVDCVITQDLLSYQQGTGIYVYYNSEAVLMSNTISHFSNGILSYANSTTGMKMTVEGNTITENDNGIYLKTAYSNYSLVDGTIINNNIHDNNNYEICCYTSSSSEIVDLTDNWWGRTDSLSIGAKIYDYFDNSNRSIVQFLPCLNSEAPKIYYNIADFNQNFSVDGEDLALLAVAFGAYSGDIAYNSVVDIYSDYRIDGFDLAVFGSRFGQRYQTEPSLSKLVLDKSNIDIRMITSEISDDYIIVDIDFQEVEFSGFAFDLIFDNKILELEDINLVTQNENGEVLFLSKVDKETGKAIIGVSNISVSQESGCIPPVQLKFRKIDSEKNSSFLKLNNVGLFDEKGKLFAYQNTQQKSIQLHQIPDKYLLHQNYPNPFNGETIIKFEIPEKSYIRVEIYNALGQLIHTLVDEELSAGVHSYPWKMTGKNSIPVSSGVYFYRLTSKDFIQSMKMLVIK